MAEVFTRIKSDGGEWGAVTIKRHYLRSMTNEAFHAAIRPVFQGIDEAHIAFINDQNIYALWRGKQRVVYKMLRNFVSTSLMQEGLAIDPALLASYIDPITRGDELKLMIDSAKNGVAEDTDDIGLDGVDNTEETSGDEADEGHKALRVSIEQTELYREAANQRAYRRQLHFLIVEDQVFSQKLLCEILRGVRMRNNNESPLIDTTQGVRDAWKLFLKKAPDVVFIDLNLVDGSGHTLARAIKELDPMTQVIIVTANNFEEELNVARQNNVDGFITKPYNKKQILDCVDRYIGTTKNLKGGHHGTSS